jgi:hypothetical protein
VLTSEPICTTLLSGGDLAVVGRRSSWWQRRRGSGGALYSRGGGCSGGGVRWWSKAVLDGEVASTGEEEGCRFHFSMIPYGGRRLTVVAGLAWLSGA